MDFAAALAFICYAATAVFTPICLVALQKELGFNLASGGFIEAVRNTLIVVVLLGSGFLAAHLGKGASVGYGLSLLGAALVCYSIAPSYFLVLAAVALIGLGSGVIEGLLNPLIHDLHPGDSGKYLNFLNAFWSVGVLAMVLISGELLTRMVSWRVISAWLGVFCFCVGVFFLLNFRCHERKGGILEVIGHNTRILRHPRFWVFCMMMVLGGGIEGGLTFWTASYVQINLSGTARTAGIATACFAGGMAVARMAWGWLIPQKHLSLLILISAVLGGIISVFIPFIGNVLLFYAMLFVIGIAVACFWPSLQSYAAESIPVDSTALFILLSCSGIPGFAAVCWLMGLLGDHFGLQVGFLVLPALFAALALVVHVERRSR